jgi:S-adenosylmethionine-diacylglycerol 3-amino-3-carboxypropyl transferase
LLELKANIMKPIQNGQVQLQKLVFSQNWEDPAADEKALGIKNGDRVFAITSGGCNSLGFLRFKPKEIYCVDINPAQTYLMEIRKAMYRRLDYADMCKMMGLENCRDRLRYYRVLRFDLSSAAIDFWENHQHIIRQGIMMNGRYERFVKIAGMILRTLQGASKTRAFFNCQSTEDQKLFYDERWDNGRWRWIFSTLFNKKRLARKGLQEEYFHFDDGSHSFSESFYRRAAHAMKDIPVRSNYFIALYLMGHYMDREHLPECLKETNFGVIREWIDHLHPVTGDSKYWLEKLPKAFFDAMALSNICELMDERDTLKFFTEVARTGKNGCRIVFRNLMIGREVPSSLRHTIVKDELLSKQLQLEDRSFVYGKVAAYRICK